MARGHVIRTVLLPSATLPGRSGKHFPASIHQDADHIPLLAILEIIMLINAHCEVFV